MRYKKIKKDYNKKLVFSSSKSDKTYKGEIDSKINKFSKSTESRMI